MRLCCPANNAPLTRHCGLQVGRWKGDAGRDEAVSVEGAAQGICKVWPRRTVARLPVQFAVYVRCRTRNAEAASGRASVPYARDRFSTPKEKGPVLLIR